MARRLLIAISATITVLMKGREGIGKKLNKIRMKYDITENINAPCSDAFLATMVALIQIVKVLYKISIMVGISEFIDNGRT